MAEIAVLSDFGHFERNPTMVGFRGPKSVKDHAMRGFDRFSSGNRPKVVDFRVLGAKFAL